MILEAVNFYCDRRRSKEREAGNCGNNFNVRDEDEKLMVLTFVNLSVNTDKSIYLYSDKSVYLYSDKSIYLYSIDIMVLLSQMNAQVARLGKK